MIRGSLMSDCSIFSSSLSFSGRIPFLIPGIGIVRGIFLSVPEYRCLPPHKAGYGFVQPDDGGFYLVFLKTADRIYMMQFPAAQQTCVLLYLLCQFPACRYAGVSEQAVCAASFVE